MSKESVTIRILFFARARDLAGADELTWNCPVGMKVSELKLQLAQQIPAIAPLLDYSAISINCDYANNSHEIPANAEIAIIPPVSGG